MAWRIVDYHKDKLVDFLETHMNAAECVELCFDAFIGKRQTRQRAVIPREDWEALGAPEAVLERVASKITSAGRYRLRAYYGAERLQPECNFEAETDNLNPTQAPDSVGAATRDLATRLQENAKLLAEQYAGAMSQINQAGDKLLDFAKETSARERATQDTSASTMMVMAVENASLKAQIMFLEDKIERLENEKGGVLSDLLDRLEPEQVERLIQTGLALGAGAVKALLPDTESPPK